MGQLTQNYQQYLGNYLDYGNCNNFFLSARITFLYLFKSIEIKNKYFQKDSFTENNY